MDSDSEVKKFKWLIIFSLLLIVSLFVTWGEAMYLVNGRVVEGEVIGTELIEDRGRRGRTREKLLVEFRFTDAAGHHRTGSDKLSPKADVPREGPILISYRPGVDGPSRVAGNADWMGLALAGFCFGMVGWHGGRVLKDAHDWSREAAAREARDNAGKRYRF